MRRFFYATFLLATWATIISYLCCSLSSFISPERILVMPVLALAFPYVAIVLLVLIIIWFFIKKKYGLYLLLFSFIGITNLTHTWAINFPRSNASLDTSNSIRILSWNIQNFGFSEKYLDTPNSVRRRMLAYLKQSHADIICLQEMTEYTGDAYLSHVQAMKDIGYRYCFKPTEVERQLPSGIQRISSVFFSKFPITDSASQLLGDSSYPERVSYADILVKGKMLRVSTCHFKSINLLIKVRPPDNQTPFHNDTSFIYTASKLEKLMVFGREHSQQAAIAKSFIANSPYPLIFTADLNSVPTSHAYHVLASGLQDAFLQEGFGVGGSLDSLPKTLRIDFMLADKKLNIVNYHQDRISLSDHYPHFMDIEWKR